MKKRTEKVIVSKHPKRMKRRKGTKRLERMLSNEMEELIKEREKRGFKSY